MQTATIATRQPRQHSTFDQPFTPCEEMALDRLIDGLRTGRINDVVVRHLEVDGVIQLDPLFDLAGAEPCGQKAA